MGGDGQALANKRTLLQKSKLYEVENEGDENAQHEKQTARERAIERWSHCALSFDRLQYPIAFSLAGDIFSKQSIVSLLMERKKDMEDGVAISGPGAEIKKLSDVREIENEMDMDSPVVSCPVTSVSTTSGNHKFVGFWGCGHVVSSTACDTEKDKEEGECPFCGASSCVVRLVLDSEEDSNSQRKRLRSFLRSQRKRKRDDTDE